MAFNHIAVIGAGAWGSALALTCARAGRKVTLWERDPANAAQLAATRESRLLPGVSIDDSVLLAADLADAAAADALLLAVPAQSVRAAATGSSATVDVLQADCAKWMNRPPSSSSGTQP